MANYFADMEAVGHATNAQSAIHQPAAALRRFKVYELIFSSDAAAADTTGEWTVQRTETAPIGTAVTPSALDPADGATGILVKEAVTVNGTLTAGVFPLRVGVNQRSAFRWVAKTGREIVVPVANDDGLHIFCSNVATQVVTVHFED